MPEYISLTDLIIILIEFQMEGFGDFTVGANDEYMITGATVDSKHKRVELDCFI